ncbi:hypothetical protein [Streptomyces rochei]|uniref:hypothetical protein n=1 Tax=Streptomyces rochei TaxID=1928 RepID=UPI0033C89A46
MKNETATALLMLHPSGLHDDDIRFAALREELLSLPSVKRVDPAPAEGQEINGYLTAKSGAAIGIAGLTLTFAPFALKQAVALLRAWTERQKARSIILEMEGERIEIKASSNREQRQAMELFIQRHTRAPELPTSGE